IDVCTPPPTGMLSWWQAETNAADIAGGNDGTLQGSGTYSPGRVGQAFVLNGSTDYVSIPNESAYDLNAMTVDAWIRVDGDTQFWPPIVTKGDSSWRLHRWVDGPYVSFGTSGLSNVDLIGNIAVNDGAWHHVAGTWNPA